MRPIRRRWRGGRDGEEQEFGFAGDGSKQGKAAVLLAVAIVSEDQ